MTLFMQVRKNKNFLPSNKLIMLLAHHIAVVWPPSTCHFLNARVKSSNNQPRYLYLLTSR